MKIVEASGLALEEWLKVVVVPSWERGFALIPDYCFPSDEHKNEYLASVSVRNTRDVNALLRIFLVPAGTLNHDILTIKTLVKHHKEKALSLEWVRRFLRGESTWEGVTWVLDLLHRPKLAIDVINSYLSAHIWCMPDWRVDGLFDAMAVIRARHLEQLHPRDAILSLTPRDFELVTALLFQSRGFDVTVTPRSRDGGYDVRLGQTTAGSAESAIVECKRFDANVGVQYVRGLLGSVEINGVTRGLVVCTSKFTRSARKEAAKTSRLELIDYDTLCSLLNEHFGPHWSSIIDRIVVQARHEFESSGNPA